MFVAILLKLWHSSLVGLEALILSYYNSHTDNQKDDFGNPRNTTTKIIKKAKEKKTQRITIVRHTYNSSSTRQNLPWEKQKVI